MTQTVLIYEIPTLIVLLAVSISYLQLRESKRQLLQDMVVKQQELAEDNQSLQKKLTQAEDNHTSITEEKSQLLSKIEQLNLNLSQSQQSVRDLEQAKITLDKNLQQEKVQVTSLNSQITQLQQEKEDLSTQLHQSAEQLNSLNSQITQLQQEKEDLASQIQQLNQSVEEVDSLNSQVAQLQQEKEDLQTQLNQSLVQVNTLKPSVEKTQQEQEDITIQLPENIQKETTSTIESEKEKETDFVSVNHEEEKTEVAASSDTKNTFADKQFVIVGTLSNMNREQAKTLIHKAGGRVTSTPTSKTDYIIVGKAPGKKLKQAQKIAVPTISEAKFLELLQESGILV
jgi:epidermal growth factor receptor substrate 15